MQVSFKALFFAWKEALQQDTYYRTQQVSHHHFYAIGVDQLRGKRRWENRLRNVGRTLDSLSVARRR